MYNFDDYSATLKTGVKSLEERIVANKVIKILNENMYIDYTDYASFKKGNRLDNVMKHFGDNLNDLEFKAILNNIKNSNGYNENNMYSTKSHNKQLGLKTSAGALFKEE